MKNIKTLASFKTKTISKCVAFSLLMIASCQASALDVSLCAGETEKMMADGSSVKVWGYGLDSTGTGACAATVPGPQLDVAATDVDLNITLRNTLSVPVSVMIPGMKAKATIPNDPVFFADGTYADGKPKQRVRSLVAETAAGTSHTYSFDAKAGTHLYQSGTHPAVQVQMGLYGATVQDATAGQAYPGVSYNKDVVMLYSEIDPAMHDAIAGSVAGALPTYGPTGSVTSTIGYKARYYLVNGESYTPGSTVVAGNAGERILIRFLNAGLESHVPVLQGKHMSMVAEYGNKYPFARQQYSALLAAGATKDAIFTPTSVGDYPLYDRRLRLTNSAAPGAGGLMSILTVAAAGPASPAAVAVADTASTLEDTVVDITVLSNDSNAVATTVEIASQPTSGSATVDAVTGTVTYTPNLNFNGVDVLGEVDLQDADSFSYTVRNVDGVASNVASVRVSVSPVNDDPVAAADTYNVVPSSITALDVLANDSDVDTGDVLTATVLTEPTLGTLDASFNYTAAATAGVDTFTYTATDSGGLTSTATVTINIADAVNEAPVALDDYRKVEKNVGAKGPNPATNNFVVIDVLTNDSDADGLDLTSVAIVTNPAHGLVVVDAVSGDITYTPAAGYRGSDVFTYTVKDVLDSEVTSNTATVRVDVVNPSQL